MITPFIFAANLIDAVLFILFINLYYDVKTSAKSIIMVIAISLVLTLDIYAEHMQYLTIVLTILVVTYYQRLLFDEFNYYYFYISGIAAILVKFSQVLGVLSLRLFLNYSVVDDYAVINIVSKVIALFLILLLHRRFRTNVDYANTKQFSIVILILLTSVQYDMDYIVLHPNESYAYYRSVITIAFALSIFSIVSNYQKEIIEKIKTNYEREQIRILRNEHEKILKLEHNMTYILLHLKMLSELNEKEAINVLVDSYVGRIKDTEKVIITNDSYFDYKIHQLVILYKENGVELNIRGLFSEDTITQQVQVDQFVNFLSNISYVFIERVKRITLYIEKDDNLLSVRLITEYHKSIFIELKQLNKRNINITVSENDKMILYYN